MIVKRALIVANVASMIDQFCGNNMYVLMELGYDVHVACNFDKPGNIDGQECAELKKSLEKKGIKYYNIHFTKEYLNLFEHIRAYKEIKEILINNYNIIHSNSPIASAITRIAGRRYKKTGTKLVYTAHGFHFYKKAPLINWLLFYPIEKKLSKFTDVLITINRDDYILAKNKMAAKKTEYICGVGIDIKKFSDVVVDKEIKRKALGIPEDAFLILSVGELNKNKNHKIVIEAISRLKNCKIHYLIVGIGKKRKYLEKLAKELNVNLHLLGYRCDVDEIYKISDCFILPSIREGLNVSLIEAIASGLNVVCSKIRGNNDFEENGVTYFELNDVIDLSNKINSLKLRTINSREVSVNKYDSKEICIKLKSIYKEI